MSKLGKLQIILKTMKRVLIAYSGGADSTLLLKIAADTLGKKNVLAVIAASETYPASEIDSAVKIAKIIKVNLSVIKTEELKDQRFLKNPAERCYYCKLELFGKLKKIARKNGYRFVLDGANYDDRLDFRPGAKAGRALGIKSPLKEAGFTKIEIRKLSKILKLFLKPGVTEKIAEKLKKIGYTYITLDIEGFRSGSMNLVLKGRK